MIQSTTTAYVGGRGWGGRGEGGGWGGGQERRATKIKIIQQRGNEISSFLDICVELDSVLHGLLDSTVPEN
jgi:hypothetical protein